MPQQPTTGYFYSYHPVVDSDEDPPTKLSMWVPGLEMVYASVRRRYKENYPTDKQPLDPRTQQNMLSSDYLRSLIGVKMSAENTSLKTARNKPTGNARAAKLNSAIQWTR